MGILDINSILVRVDTSVGVGGEGEVMLVCIY
jgi:hypothetical protein